MGQRPRNAVLFDYPSGGLADVFSPVRVVIVEKPEDYLYTSARNPATARNAGLKGLIKVDYW